MEGDENLEAQLIETIGTQGAWALLSVGLIFYILRAQEKRDEIQEKREQKYQEIVDSMVNKLSILENLSEDIRDIKTKLNETIE